MLLLSVFTLFVLVATQLPLPAAAGAVSVTETVTVTPKGPTFRDDISSVDIPSDLGVRYYIYVGDSDEPVVKDGLPYSKPGRYSTSEGIVANTVLRIEARSAGSSTVLAGTVSWEHAFLTADHMPQFSDASTSVTLPTLLGVTFAVDGVDAVDTAFGVQGQTTTVTARSIKSGDEVGRWTHKFPFVREPAAPVFDSQAVMVKIPYGQSGVRYYLTVGPDQTLLTKDGLSFSKPATYSAADGLLAGSDVMVTAGPAGTQDLVVGQTTWKTHFFSESQMPVFDDAANTVTIPAVDGISFAVDGQPVDAGTHAYSAGNAVEVTAQFLEGGDFLQSWSHAFPKPAAAVTPKGPTFREDISAVYIPSDEGVRYYIFVGDSDQPITKDGLPYSKPGTYTTEDGVLPGQVIRVEARTAGSLTQLSGDTLWWHVFFDSASSPSFDDVATTVHIPQVEGLQFAIDGVAVSAGDHSAVGGAQVSVTASVTADPSGQPLHTWDYAFSRALTPKGPIFRDDVSTLVIPPDDGIRYYIYQGDSLVPVVKDSSQDFSKPGTYSSEDGLRAGQTIRVVAKPAGSTSVLSGTAEWSHVLPAKIPIGPTFRDEASSIYIPSDSGIRYYIYVGQSESPLTKDPTQNFSKPGLYAASDGVVEGVQIRVVASPVVATTMLNGDRGWNHTFPKRPTYPLTSGDAFDDPSSLLTQGWSVYRNSAKGLPVGQNTAYLASNVRVADGKLQLITKRHCVSVNAKGEVDEELTDANVSEAPCPAGKRSVFSSGRLNTDFIYNNEATGTKGPFSMEVRARMSDGTVPGFHFAGWVRNNKPYCDKQSDDGHIAELDTMEVFTEATRQSSINTSHVGCKGNASSADTNRTYSELAPSDGIAGQWHTYRMEWNGYSIRYFLDGEPVPLRGSNGDSYETTAVTLGLSDADFNRMMNEYPWQLIFDSRAFEDHTGWIAGPQHEKPFAQRTDLVDYVTMTPVQSVASYGAIGAKWRENQWLGSPQTAEADDTGGTGSRFQRFEKGAVFWSPDTGAVIVTGAIRDTYLQDASVRAAIGLPTTGEFRSTDGNGAYQYFQKGQMHWSAGSGAHATRGAIQEYWASNGWEFGALGYPIGEELSTAGGASQRFQGGTVFWSAATGAHRVAAGMLSEYAANGREGGALGFPLTDEIGGLRDGGAFQTFQHGQIHWSPTSGASATRGAINAYWGANNWENGYAGYPIDEELMVNGGASQRFQSATLLWSRTTGNVFGVRGAIRAKYGSLGWEQGALGFPASDERTLLGGASQSFGDGSQVHWSAATGAHVTKGAIQGLWAQSGWERGRLGYPTSDEQDDPGVANGKKQSFSGGEIHWSPAGSSVSWK